MPQRCANALQIHQTQEIEWKRCKGGFTPREGGGRLSESYNTMEVIKSRRLLGEAPSGDLQEKTFCPIGVRTGLQTCGTQLSVNRVHPLNISAGGITSITDVVILRENKTHQRLNVKTDPRCAFVRFI